MDEAFLLRARRLLDERRTILDHKALVAKISSQAAATPTARACLSVNQANADHDEGDRVSALILGDGEGRTVTGGRIGCFNRAIATRPVNTL